MKLRSIISLFLFAVLFCQCSSQELDENLLEQNWISDVEIDANNGDYLLSSIINIKDGKVHLISLRSEKESITFDYQLVGKELIMLTDDQKIPLWEITSLSSDQMEIVIPDTDTLHLKSIKTGWTDAEKIKAKLLNHSFRLKEESSSLSHLVHFTERDLLLFSKDVELKESDFPQFNFSRLKYELKFNHDIPIILIFNRPPNFSYPLFGPLFIDEQQITIHTFIDGENHHSELIPIKREMPDSAPLKKEWRLWGGKRTQWFKFLDHGKLLYTKEDQESQWTWELDESGYLLMMTDEGGNRTYGIKNFDLSKRRIGYEFSKAKFSDMLNLE